MFELLGLRDEEEKARKAAGAVANCADKSSCANGIGELAWEDQRAASSLGRGRRPPAVVRGAPGRNRARRKVFWIDGGRDSLGRSDQIKGRKVKNESALQQSVHVS